MDYEKKYNNALEVVRELQKDWASTQNRAAKEIELAFPELKESEDERIRKELLEYLIVTRQQDFVAHPERQRWIAYLEKHEEPKWSPSEGEMGVLYKLCYISNQITDEDDTELTRLYQDLKREYFNGHSFENMFSNGKQKEQKPLFKQISDSVIWDSGLRTGIELGKKEQKPNPYTGTGFDYNGHHWGMCARDGGVEIIVDGKIRDRIYFEESKELFIKALERAVEQTKKGYELTDCDKHSWWEDFKACTVADKS